MYRTTFTLLLLLLTWQLGQTVGLAENRASGGSWDYTDFSVWGNLFPTCGTGTNQQKGSPIDIVTMKTASANNQFNFMEQDSVKNKFKTLKGEWARKGFTFQFTVTDPSGGPMVQYNSEFTESSHNYELLQIHYHWGSSASEGSEHTVDGDKYPLEAHFVHGNTKYKATGDYTDHADGLLVIGVLYKIYSSATDSSTATNWIKWPANNAQKYAANEASGTTTAIETGNQYILWKTMVEALKNGHYNYKGSLTTPGCQEVVTWVVAKKVMPVKSEDLANFRKLKKDGSFVTKNWRPTQDLGTGDRKRVVYSMDKSWDDGSWAHYYGR